MSTPTDLLAVAAGETTAYSYVLGAHADPNGTVLDITWTGVPNRDPNTSGDFVAIWQNNGSIPWGEPALNTQQVTNTTPDGDIAFAGLSLATLPYVVAYSVGSNSSFHNIAAAIPIGPGGAVDTPQPTTVAVGFVGATSLIIDYTTPIGTTPKTFGHTVSLVKGTTYNPLNAAPIASVTPSDNANDAASFNGVTMVAGQYYTAAYLTGVDSKGAPLPSSVAATVTFLVAEA